jgi:hypothetical protein
VRVGPPTVHAMSSFVLGLASALEAYGVYDLDALASVLESNAAGMAEYVRSADCQAAIVVARAIETALAEVASEAARVEADATIEVATADAVAAEAFLIINEQEARAEAAEARAVEAERLAQEAAAMAAAAEARAVAAEARAVAAEQRAGRTGRGGGRGGRGSAAPPPPPRPPPPPPPPPPPEQLNPSPDELIDRILSINILSDGSMTDSEALQILQVTTRRPKWLLSQVHPDKNPHRRAEAKEAASRVNQAMDIRMRHVTEV